jgi:hypothetical protein
VELQRGPAVCLAATKNAFSHTQPQAALADSVSSDSSAAWVASYSETVRPQRSKYAGGPDDPDTYTLRTFGILQPAGTQSPQARQAPDAEMAAQPSHAATDVAATSAAVAGSGPDQGRRQPGGRGLASQPSGKGHLPHSHIQQSAHLNGPLGIV